MWGASASWTLLAAFRRWVCCTAFWRWSFHLGCTNTLQRHCTGKRSRVLRLRERFAARSTHAAQDDSVGNRLKEKMLVSFPAPATLVSIHVRNFSMLWRERMRFLSDCWTLLRVRSRIADRMIPTR